VEASGEAEPHGVAAVTRIRAAGGVVWRPGDGGAEICVVHRPRYDDWSLPKGKLEAGEHPLLAAVREVGEEAGVLAVPQVRLDGVNYAMRDGTPKTVDYWSMRCADQEPALTTAEVDELRWMSVDEAARRLTYAHDVRVVRDFAQLPRVTAVATLVRHAHAGKRGTWSGPDDARPLDARGRAQAAALAPLQALARPVRLVSATPVRCVQTLEPLAARLDLPIEVDSRFNEPQPGQSPDETALAAAAAVLELATSDGSVAVCSQGKVMPDALALLLGEPAAGRFATPKGDGWLIAIGGGGGGGERAVAADRFGVGEPTADD
jgi:8-oxo-dGTP pyrophosphatase MutT (NUDIX family)/phosphohistidine phosphatase SixA